MFVLFVVVPRNDRTWHHSALLLFPGECAWGDSDIEFVQQVAVGRIAVDHALLLIVDGIGHIYLAVYGIDSQSVVSGVAGSD